MNPELDDKEKVGADPAEIAARDQQQAAQRNTEFGKTLDEIRGLPETSASQSSKRSGSAFPYSNPDTSPPDPFGGRGLTGKLGAKAGNFFARRRKLLIGTSIVGTLITVVGVGMFGLLAPFKLMFMKENIDSVRMKRLTHLFDRRSDRFMNHLIKAEIAGDKDGKNRYFEAKGWVGEGNPFVQFSKDMRTEKFFKSMEQNQGVRFIREYDPRAGTDRLVRLNVRGEEINFKDIDLDGDAARFEALVEERYSSNKQARAAYNQSVRENTKWYQMMQRYHARKWGYERLGITKWRFFEGTRDKVDESVNKRWNQAILRVTGDGAGIKCLFNLGACPETGSLNDDRNRVGPADPDIEELNQQAEEDTANNPNAEPGSELDTGDFQRNFAKRAATKFIPIVNILDGIDTFNHLNEIFKNKTLSKVVAATRQKEAIASYMQLGVISHQLKSGENVSGEEVNATMKMFDGIERSEGYQNNMALQNVAMGPSIKSPVGTAYAAGEEDDGKSRWATIDMIAFYGGSNFQKLETFYNSNIGPVADLVLEPCNSFATLYLCKIAGWVSGAIGEIFGQLTRPGMFLTNKFFSAVTGQDPKEAMQSVLADATVLLVGAARCAADAIPGQKFQCADAGGAALQSALLGDMGAGPLAGEDLAMANQDMALWDQETTSQKSMWTRMASINPEDQSLVGRILMQTPETPNKLAAAVGGSVANVGVMGAVEGLGNSFMSLFRPAWAADAVDNNIYGAEEMGLTRADLAKEPFDGKSEAECEAEIAAFDEEKAKGGKPATSMCKFDSGVAHDLTCKNGDDASCASFGGGGSTAPSEGGAELATGSLEELAQQILDNPNITSSGGSAQQDLEATARGGVGASGRKSSPRLLALIAGLGKNHKFTITSFHRTGGGTSNHDIGAAMDIGAIDGVVVEYNTSNPKIRTFLNAAGRLMSKDSSNCEIGTPYTSASINEAIASLVPQCGPGNVFFDQGTAAHVHLAVP